eukprot:SAG11_NODE_157_length_14147_cov_8.545202_7_plen_63_part_00
MCRESGSTLLGGMPCADKQTNSIQLGSIFYRSYGNMVLGYSLRYISIRFSFHAVLNLLDLCP